MVCKIAKVGNDQTLGLAAKELARCLSAMDKHLEVLRASFPCLDARAQGMLWLYVCPELAKQVEDPALDDGYAIDVAGAVGSIRGTNARSVLMGVYRFLRELGCRWIRPGADGELLPECCIADAKVQVSEKASYRHRGVCIEGAVSYENVVDMIDWMPKIGLNAYFNQFQVPVTFYNRWYGHGRNPYLKGKPLSVVQIEGIRDQTVEDMKRRGLLYHYAGHGWTCDPFGLRGKGWDVEEYEVSRSVSRFFAKVDGKRAIWRGIPLNTNLCYSQSAVRRKMADAVVQRCKEMPELDYVHVWLSDGINNFCECEKCKAMRPADWYVTLLNEIDAKLEKCGLSTKIVFLLYHDLLWEPQQVQLKNPGRFVLMFAPISRTYSTSYADAPYFDEQNLPEFNLNKLTFPKSVGENLAWLRRWQKQEACDGFVFDYHYMWDHFYDPGYYETSKILFRDMQSLHNFGLNGMVSCQNQRVFFPNGLGMTAMAAALWNEKADFDTVAEDYYRAAYGPDWAQVRRYMQDISSAFDPAYIRNKDKNARVSPENAQKLAQVPQIVQAYGQLVSKNAADRKLPEAVRVSWEHLKYHGVYCQKLALAFQMRAEGNMEEAKKQLQEVLKYIRSNEMKLQRVLDVFGFQLAVVDRVDWD